MMRLHQYFFAGLVYAVKAGFVIGLLYGATAAITMLIFSQSLDSGALFFFTALPAGVAAVASLWSYVSFMLLRFWRKGGKPTLEAWLVPSGAALIVNAFFIIQSQDTDFWIMHITNAVVSIIGIILCRLIYVGTWQKLEELSSKTSENL